MNRAGLVKALWILFFLLLCWPFIRIADAAVTVLGVPVLLAYTFLAWAVLVGVLAAVAGRLED
ncbi:MAG: hypothetical protein ACM3NF_07475 [Gemmatimonadota bacterium]